MANTPGTQSVDASRDDFEPAEYVPRWIDGSPKDERFWNDHDRAVVTHWLQRIAEHRALKAQMQAERETFDGGL